jgi:dynactin-4
MSRPFPYTYISCPCADTPVPDPARKRRSRESPQKSPQKPPPERANIEEKKDSAKDEYEGEDEDEEQTFDPRSPRSNFSLYPPAQLLYCEECHQIKCPRCITEEIVSWYCPSCLFETPSSMVRSDGNRYVLGTLRGIKLMSEYWLTRAYLQVRSKLLQLSNLYSSACCQ